MKSRSDTIRQYIITSLAVSMICIIWIFCIDAIFYGTWRFLKVVCSVTIFAFMICLLEVLIKNYLENHFFLSVVLEFGMIVLLFFVFGKKFNWYPKNQEYMFFVYSISIYAVGYFLRLVGIGRDAEIINKCIEIRKHKE